eukprot:scaffold103168_cov71-Attheya_sp.AAC.3
MFMSNGSASDIPESRISSEKEQSVLIGDLNRSSGVLIEAEQGESDDLVVSTLEEEGKVVETDEEDEDFAGFENFIVGGSDESLSIESNSTIMTGRFRTAARSDVDKVVVDVVKKASE